MSIDADRAFCRAVLPMVSRTFALGIRLLPARLRDSVETAYLLCRIADTIEDSLTLRAEQQTLLLDHFATTLDLDTPDLTSLRDTFSEQPGPEALLAARADVVLRTFHGLPEADRAAIRPWVQEMARGMGEFVRLAGDRDGGLTVLASVADLDRYCYYVAGTVGHLLTGLFRAHHRQIDDARFGQLDGLATSFGLGLQLTNIIKDVADDRRRGWSFVPRDLCQTSGVRPEDLHDPAHASAARQVMNSLIEKARGHLQDALAYSTLLPRSAWRVRVFCLTSLYFAVATLRRAAHDPRLLDADHKVKISRRDVYRTVAVTHLIAPSDTLVRWYWHRLAA